MNMNHFYFLVIVSILISIPHTVNAFFRVNPNNINVTRNITCRLNGNQTSGSNFQLCAIRVYQGTINASVQTFSLYNGFHYGNTLRRYIQKGCSNENNALPTNTGIWSCNSPLPFETSLASIQLCVCSTDNCNADIDSCEQSVTLNSDIPQLLDIMPDLNLTLQCSDTLNANNTCEENPYIDVTLCIAYVRNNSILCAITVNETEIIQTSLIYENYEAYLDEKIYEITSALYEAPNNSYTESNNNVFYTYSNNATDSIEECACTSYSFCNENITTCASLTTLIISQIETEMDISSSTNVQSSTLFETSEETTNTIALSTGATSITTTMFTTSTVTDSTTITLSTDSIITAEVTDSITTAEVTGFIITTQPAYSNIITVTSTVVTPSTTAQSKYCLPFFFR